MARTFTSSFTILLTVWMSVSHGSSIKSPACSEVKDAYIKMGYSPLDVPVNSVALQGMYYLSLIIIILFNYNYSC